MKTPFPPTSFSLHVPHSTRRGGSIFRLVAANHCTHVQLPFHVDGRHQKKDTLVVFWRLLTHTITHRKCQRHRPPSSCRLSAAPVPDL